MMHPSLRRFTIKAPPLAANSAMYNPPSIILTSPHDDWLFAYYPGKFTDDVACIHRRGPQVDLWIVKDHWIVPKGARVLAAQWLGPEREVCLYYILISLILLLIAN